MKNRKLLILFLFVGILVGSVGTHFAQRRFYDHKTMSWYADGVKVEESEAYRCAKYLFCDVPFKQQELLHEMEFRLQVFICVCLSFYWDYPPPDWDPTERYPEIFVWFFEDAKRVKALYREWAGLDDPKYRERAQILYEKAKAAVGRKKKEMLPVAGEWDFVRKPIFRQFSAFSYQDFIDQCDYELLDEESSLAAGGRAEVYLTGRMEAQYIAKGCSKKDPDGKYFLYFLIGENRVLACPLDGNENLYASVTPKTFSQLIISADGSWKIVE